MKRCIICGNVGDDSSTKCDVCGNPFIDTTGKTPEEMQAVENIQDEEAIKATFAQAVSGSMTAARDEKKAPQVPKQPMKQEAANAPEQSAAQETAKVSEQSVVQKAPQASEQPVAQKTPQAPEQAVTQGAAEASEQAVTRKAPQVSEQPVVQEAGKEQTDAYRTPRRPQGRPVHRAAGGPQIYGQEDDRMTQPGYERQGTVRRNVRGVSGQASQGRPMQPEDRRMQSQQGANGAQAMRNRQSGRPVNGPQGRAAYTSQGQSANAPQSMNAQGQQPYSQPMRQGNPAQAMGARPSMPSGNYQARRIQETSRALMKSPVFLLIAILNTACFVGAIAAIFLREMNYSQVVRLIEDINLPGQVSGYVGSFTSILSMLDSGALFANLALQIPELLFLIGIWMVFFAALRSKEEMSSIGFVLVKATVLINMVVACIVMAVILIVSVAVVVGAGVSGSTPLMIGSVATLVIVIAIVMLVIMYYFSQLATIKTCRLNSVAGESYGKASVYVAVIHIVLALVAIVDLLSGIVNSEMSNIVRAIGKMGWLLLLAVWIFMYRDKMEEAEE